MKTRTKVIIAIGSNRNQEENVLKAHEYLRCMFKNSLFGPRMWTEQKSRKSPAGAQAPAWRIQTSF